MSGYPGVNGGNSEANDVTVTNKAGVIYIKGDGYSVLDQRIRSTGYNIVIERLASLPNGWVTMMTIG